MASVFMVAGTSVSIIAMAEEAKRAAELDDFAPGHGFTSSHIEVSRAEDTEQLLQTCISASIDGKLIDSIFLCNVFSTQIKILCNY